MSSAINAASVLTPYLRGESRIQTELTQGDAASIWEEIVYKDYLIQTYVNFGEPSSAAVRARPLAGQGVSTSLNAECSRKMRTDYPVGTIFKITAKLANKGPYGAPYLASHYSWPFEVLSKAEAEKFLRKIPLRARSSN